MSIMENLFSNSPFIALQSHMEKVAECVGKLDELFNAFLKKDSDIQKLSDEVSLLEHSADLTKNDIKSNLNRGLFLAIKRIDLLQILSLQDAIADTAEDIAVLVTLKKLDPDKGLKADLRAFLEKNMSAVESVHKIILELEKLMQYTFGGSEAKKVKQMVNDVAFIEHEADLLQRDLLRKLYNMENKLSYASFNLWMNLVSEIASLSNLSENLAYKISNLIENN
jgi:uncharacterized protein